MMDAGAIGNGGAAIVITGLQETAALRESGS
jgi:hypothetical protein